MANISSNLLAPGAKFGDYTVVKRLGVGGMGAVYLIRGDESGAEFAVKVMDPKVEKSDPEYKKRFIFEAELAMKIRHPNLIAVYDVGRDPDTGLAYLIMEYVPGGTVRDRIAKWGALSLEESADIVYRVAQALVAVHERNIVHRDVKPDNIMFTADGVTPKLADLGIARLSTSAGTQSSTITQNGYLVGSPAYMSPEQMEDSHHADIRSDIHALGVTFWEMLAGRRPYEGDDAMAIIARAMKGVPIPDIRRFRPDVPPDVAHLIMRMCHPDVTRRMQTPQEVVDALRSMRNGFGKMRPSRAFHVSAADIREARTMRPTTSRRKTMNPVVPVAAVLAALTISVAAIGFLFRAIRPAPTQPVIPMQEVAATPAQAPQPDTLSVFPEEPPHETAISGDPPPQTVVEQTADAAPAHQNAATAAAKPSTEAPPPVSSFVEPMATELRRYAMYRQMCEKGRATEANAAILAAVNAARMIDPDLRAYDFDGKSDLPGHDTALPPKDRAVLRAGKLFLMMELLRKDCPTIMDNYARAKRKATIKLTRARPLSIHDTVALLSNAAQKDLFPFFRSFGVYADAAETKFRAVFAERPANAGRR